MDDVIDDLVEPEDDEDKKPGVIDSVRSLDGVSREEAARRLAAAGGLVRRARAG